MRHTLRVVGVVPVAATLLLASCGGEDGPSADDKREVVEHYAAGVHAAYGASLASATELDLAIQAFADDPTQATMDAAKQAWLAARNDYGLTEAFRFYGGPIDDEETGPEGQINAWPLDEAYIDYVDGDETAGIINAVDDHPTIDAELITSLNEEGGEANISSGWHAIEFLLWGQDLSDSGPGERPVTDYTEDEQAQRRMTYLTVASMQLLDDLTSMADAWAPDADNYRAAFVEREPDEALTDIITGIGFLTRGELANERMNVAYEARSQEDEHSCFSDNTNADLVANELGIRMVLTGAYPGAEGPGVMALFEAADEQVATDLTASVDDAVGALEAIPAPFDQHLADGVPDDDPGRAAVLDGINALDAQADRIIAAADALGLTIITA
ncbi:MAG: imelysin family protein [Ilumatobacteraceae bacterium]